ncbi:peptidoglycan-binding protein [Streptomyces laurentii]|uniref:peptidoglycan-binding protein n=1 Tax=Streptomyces laurentii TaxID=39478 RepID=UPI0036A6E870
MKRSSSVIRAAVLAAAAAVLAVGCTPTADGPGAGPGTGTGTGTAPTPADRVTAPAPSTTTPPAPAPSTGTPSHKPAKPPKPSEPATPSATPTADGKPPAPTATPTPRPTPTVKILMAEGAENARVRELQARLRQTGVFDRAPTGFYGSITTAAVRSYQRKHGLSVTGSVDQKTWDKLVAATHRPTAAELRPPTTNVLDKPDPRCMTGRVLCISKESRTLAWMIDGKVVSAMDVRFGSENTPTREGIFKVEWKARDWTSTIYHSPMPYSMFFSGGQAVHYSADFAARGYNGASHGCVNVRDRSKLASVFDQVKVGDKVVVHW